MGHAPPCKECPDVVCPEQTVECENLVAECKTICKKCLSYTRVMLFDGTYTDTLAGYTPECSPTKTYYLTNEKGECQEITKMCDGTYVDSTGSAIKINNSDTMSTKPCPYLITCKNVCKDCQPFYRNIYSDGTVEDVAATDVDNFCIDPCVNMTLPEDELIKEDFDCTVSLDTVSTYQKTICKCGEIGKGDTYEVTTTATQECYTYPDYKGTGPAYTDAWETQPCPIFGDQEVCFDYDWTNPSTLSFVTLGNTINDVAGELTMYLYNYTNGTGSVRRYWLRIFQQGSGSWVTGWIDLGAQNVSTMCIKRTGTTTEYLVNGTAVYTGATAYTGPLYANANINGNGGTWGSGTHAYTNITHCPL